MPEISCFTSLYIVFIIFWPGSIFDSMHIECIFYPPPYLILNVSYAIVYLGKYRNVLSLAYDWIFHSHVFWQICLVIFFYVYKFLTASIVHAVSRRSYQSAFLISEAKNHRDPSILALSTTDNKMFMELMGPMLTYSLQYDFQILRHLVVLNEYLWIHTIIAEISCLHVYSQFKSFKFFCTLVTIFKSTFLLHYTPIAWPKLLFSNL